MSALDAAKSIVNARLSVRSGHSLATAKPGVQDAIRAPERQAAEIMDAVRAHPGRESARAASEPSDVDHGRFE